MGKKGFNGASARRKGHQFERDCANRLKHIYPKIRRLLEYQGACANGVDLIESGSMRFQCKKHKGYVSINTIDEIEHESFLGEVPILLTAGDSKTPMAVLPFDFLIELLEVYERDRGKRNASERFNEP